ncbi:Panacea domain-containing protein [Chlorogloea sp. CCALA 695]|uniref:Panacea domain-containing protein n=1 Tax=Chlorogloea sp. CCALA 695 TaxID=2107693 RepID=UPI0011B2986D|nr:Panacea domain-containing protein [Chlorogloea sp. CCALA 695]
MKPNFQEKKATQVAAMFLKFGGGKMNYMKLIKLMYLVERSALLEWGRPVTYDYYVSMPHGPVLSETLDRINEGAAPDSDSYWVEYISASSDYQVSLLKAGCSEELSEAEDELIERIFKEFGDWNPWELVDYIHKNIPEWVDPKGSSIPIEYHSIFLAGGRTHRDAELIESEIEDLAVMSNLLG